MMREAVHRRRPPVKGCCMRGDHMRHEKSKPQPPRPPTEPCHICFNVVGVEAEFGFIETWAELPCGHKFGSHCLKIWLGLKEYPSCPICKKPMAHICGHPPMPRLTTPPEYDPADIQPGEDRVPGAQNSSSNPQPEESNAQPEAQEQIGDEAAPLAAAAVAAAADDDDDSSAQNEKIETNKEASKDEPAGCGSGAPEKNIQIAAQRVPSSSSDVHLSRPMESVSNDENGGGDNGDGNNNNNNNNNEVAASNELLAAPEAPEALEAPGVHEAPEAPQAPQAQPAQQAPNNEQPAVVAPPVQQQLLAEPAALQPAQEPRPPVIPQAVHLAPCGIAPAHASNSHARRSLRQRLHLARQPKTSEPLFGVYQDPLPIGFGGAEDYDILASLMTKGKVPRQVPRYMNMAFPRTVDLSLPCSYCFMMLDITMRDAGDHIRHRPRISKVKRSRIPGKKIAITGAKYFFAYSYYAISIALRAVTTGLDDYLNGIGKLTKHEEDRLRAYFDAMNEVRIATFGIWWGRQQPITSPAVMAPGHDGWYYSNGYYRW